MTEEENNKLIKMMTDNASEHKQIPVWKNPSFWHITALMAVFSVFYYMDVIINWAGWFNLRWGIFYTVHDLHRALFLIPAMYATYKFRLKGIIATSSISFFIFLPRALAVSPYPNPLLRALIFTISMIIMGVFLSLLLNNITKRKELEQSLWQTQSDLLRKRTESQREEAIEALQKNIDLFARIASQVPGMLYQFMRKPDGTYSVPFSNDGVTEIFGCSPEDVRNNFDPIFQAIFPEDRGRILQTIEESAASMLPWTCEYRVQLPGKPLRWIQGNSIPEKMADGAILWSGYNTDISERKQAEAELAAAQRLYRELFDNVAIGIIRTTPGPEGTFIDVNPAAVQVFEADSREQMMILHPSDIYWDASQRKIISDALTAKGFVKKEILFKSLKGNPFWGQIHSTRKTDENGNVYFDSTVENITERRQMEEKLQESEKLYRSLFDGMLNAFQYSKMIFDQGTPVDYIYLDVNSAFSSLTGLKDVIGRKVSEVLPGILQSDPELFHILGRVALTGNNEKFDIYVKALNKWFSASAYSLAKEYFVVIFEDINERKRTEKALMERELILRTMFDQSYQLMAMCSPDGRLLRVNATALDLVGVREEDVLGEYLWETTWWSHSEDEQNKIKSWVRRAAVGESIRDVTLHYDTCGNPHYIDISIKPVTDGNGVVTMILPEGRDITERKRVDEELRKLTEELEQRVAKRTAELERINKIFVDRELRMRELKERIAELEKQKDVKSKE